TRHGNCNEKSALCATWLLENRHGNEIILWVNGSTAYDHAWVVYDHNATHWDGTIANLSGDAVVVDGWTGDYYQAKHPHKFWHAALATPSPLTVRNTILNPSANIPVKEHVEPRDWATSFSPHFRLAVADQSPSPYEPQGSHLLRTRNKSAWMSVRDNDGWDEAKAIQHALQDLESGDDDFELEDD